MKRLAFGLSQVLLVMVVACSSKSSGSKTKGSQATGSGAQAAGQTAGTTATSSESSATSEGDTYDSLTCDASLQGTAWCADDSTAIFCDNGVWYSLDCASIGGDVCAEESDTSVVDCDATSDVTGG